MSSEKQRPLIRPLFAPSVKSDWSWSRLDDVSEVYDCPHSTPKLVEDASAPFVVRSQDVRSGTFFTENAGKISFETYQERIKRVEPRFGDLVYSREGTYFGIAAAVPRGVKVCLGQRMVLIRPNPSRVHHAFLRYWLNSPQIFAHIHGFRDGTVAERLNLPVIRGLAVAFPSLTEQCAIADVLSTLDDRIALLRETNATLEAIARTLFKSWFVDFDPVRARQQGLAPEGMDEATAALFPDGFEESELGPVPKGWRTLSFIETIDVIGGGTPKTSVAEYWNGDIPWFSVVDAPAMANVFVIDTEKHITAKGLSNSSTKLLPAGTTIISARGTVGKLALLGREMTMNQSCYGLRGKANDAYFTYFSTHRLVATLRQRTHGSVFDTITRDTLAGVSVIYPSAAVIGAFEETLAPVMERIKENLAQAQTLSTLRDTLLPRLISGQLSLADVEHETEACHAD